MRLASSIVQSLGHLFANLKIRRRLDSHACDGELTKMRVFFLALILLSTPAMNRERKKIILVADNDDDWRDLLSMVIRHCGYEVIEAKTGQEAIDRASRVNPNLILLDFALPEINAHEVMAHLKMNSATRQIPVFFQVAATTAQNIRWPDGAREVLYKPFDLGDLPTILHKYLPEEQVRMTPRSTKE